MKPTKKRSFRLFALKRDLQEIFKEFQHQLDVYYVPTYSDAGKISLDDVTAIENLGINFYGSHCGNMQMLVFLRSTECLWRSYPCEKDGNRITRYSTLCAGNAECINVDLNGLYQDSAIFPTEISTMYYDNEAGKQLFDEMKKIVRRQAAKVVNGYYICPNAYEHKKNYRFCTVDIKSSPKQDLQVP